MQVPPKLAIIQDTENLRKHAEVLRGIVADYNQILATMLPEECAVLQRQHRHVEMLITQCISSDATKIPINWRSHGIAAFLKRMRSALRSLASGVEAMQSNSELIRTTAAKWCVPLFDRKASNSPLHQSLDLNAKETNLRVDTALRELRT